MEKAFQSENPWRNENDWLVLIEFLRRDDAGDRARGAEAIGYLFAYAYRTDTRKLALVGDARNDVYELLFSFNSAANKTESLRLVQSNEATVCAEDEILVPHPSELAAARPIAQVLPEDVLRQVLAVAAMLFPDGSETLQ